MDARQLFQQGDLDGALAAVKQQVRDNPATAAHRTFLFQLMSVLGDWSRALTQLNVAGDLDSSAIPMVQVYREALSCEALREQVFAGERSPLVFGDPENWIALALEANKRVAKGNLEQAAKLRDEAYEDAPAVTGTVNGAEFEWIADADSRIGPFLEAIVNGRYYWIPMHRIAQADIDPPEDLRDIVWLPCHFTWANGGQSVGLIPSRYPGSQNSEDPTIVLGRKTEWSEQPEGTFIGYGQRILATDADEYPLLDIRELKINAATGP
jgi:type VI secretion system protein ImpE